MRPRMAETSEPACTKRKMLSTKSSTSCFFTSRKYSAIVRPDNPTRSRAPGGSFIWPKTSTALSMTLCSLPSGVLYLASLISSQRSLPSRVRSPTPQKTLKPPLFTAVMRISSWISTVLPTPAPPKRPILPPFANGHSRSTTFRPVSNTSEIGSWFSKAGAGRWIGQNSLASNFPRACRSSACPRRLKMRPLVISPTGTVIGAPVSTTSIPRRQPSVVDMATQRATSLPRCWETSSTTLISRSGSESVSAVLMGGSLPAAKRTSTTGPKIWATVPVLVPSATELLTLVVLMGVRGRLWLAQDLGAADDVEQLLRDALLALAVVLLAEDALHLGGRVGRVLHRDAPHGVLGGDRFQ